MNERNTNRDIAVASNHYYNYTSSPCFKHPFASPVGICPFCLKDRLIKLICSETECDHQCLSSCNLDVGSVGRVSFLIENETEKTSGVLKRSNSCSVYVKRSKFWKCGRFFKLKGRKETEKMDVFGVFGEKGVCRSMSTSTSGFRGGEGFSTSKRSTNGVGGLNLKWSSSSSNSDISSVISETTSLEESGFIDLDLGLSSKTKFDHQFNTLKTRDFTKTESDFRVWEDGGSFRVAVNDDDDDDDKEIKKAKRGLKVWRWFLRKQCPMALRENKAWITGQSAVTTGTFR